MKKILILGINIYQTIIRGVLRNILGVNSFCRFSPSCSEYATRKIKKEGIFKGGGKAFVRICKCNPYYNKTK